MSNSGKIAIRNWIADSDVGKRGIVGGADNLVELVVYVKADETCPRKLDVNLWVYDGYGEEIYSWILPMYVTYKYLYRINLVFERDRELRIGQQGKNI